ncbi:MAG TPA: Uma2 family endonuclease [Tepidisphaeraceae bacterium]|jgi:Uma2 family endonuclease|nr:Uma2 family endonuclease [Tepidisphaeraceae bacterium]
MTLGSPPTRFTPDDLLRLEEDDDHLYELVDGKLVEKEMSSLANKTAARIITVLNTFCLQHNSGDVYAEQSFQCFPHDPDQIRRPDVSLIVFDRLKSVPEEGHIRIAPDLAIEVISPNDKIYIFERKLADYRKAGIPLVWEVNPKFRFVRIHRLDRKADRLEETDAITAEPVLVGFSVLVSELLPPGETLPSSE